MVMQCRDGLRVCDWRAGNRDVYCSLKGFLCAVKYDKGKTVATVIARLRDVLESGNMTVQYTMIRE